jgi:transmembrane sensor
VSPFFERGQRAAIPAPRFRQPLTWAAALLPAALLAGWYLWPGGGAFETPIGATANIPLPDGSNVTLNTASRIRIALDDRQRRIELRSGEVFFDVAKDPTRPFIVDAGVRRIVAVGTKFSVRRDGSEVSVIVTEGAVRFDADGAGLLEAGAVARTIGDEVAVENKTVREAEEALSWRTGYLTFDETSLGEVAAEFNRYTPRPIRIASARLEDLRITGRFRATNTDAFIRVVENGFRVEVEAGEKEIVLR